MSSMLLNPRRKNRHSMGSVALCRSAGQIGCALDQLFELVKDTRIPPALSDFLLHSFKSIGDGKCLLVGPIGRQCIENIYNLQYARGHGNRIALEPIRISRSVEFLVMVPN